MLSLLSLSLAAASAYHGSSTITLPNRMIIQQESPIAANEGQGKEKRRLLAWFHAQWRTGNRQDRAFLTLVAFILFAIIKHSMAP